MVNNKSQKGGGEGKLERKEGSFIKFKKCRGLNYMSN